MQVEHRLPPVGVAVHDEAKAGISDAVRPRELSRGDEQVTGQLTVFGGEVVDGGDVAPGNEERVRRGLRVDVEEGDAVLVFVNLLRGNLA